MPITARNYAAQAVRSLKSTAAMRTLTFKPMEEAGLDNALADAETSGLVAQLIDRAVHFALPDGGVLLEDPKLKALPRETLRLPFPVITLEYCMPIHDESTKVVILASEEGSEYLEGEPGVSVVTVVGGFEPLPWFVWPYRSFLASGWRDDDLGGVVHDIKRNYLSYPYPPTPELGIGPGEDPGDHIRLVYKAARVLLQFLNALACSNVHAETLQKANEKRNQRVAKGKSHKLPIYETKYLTVDVPGKARRDPATYGTSHASPREHLRRGHIRRYEETGKSVWVNACVVNAGIGKAVDKQYRIRPNKGVAA